MGDRYTYIDEAGIWVCNDCGAAGLMKEDIIHFDSCERGESEKWEKIYSEDVDIAPGNGVLPLCFTCDREPTCASAYVLDNVIKCPLEPIS